MEVLDIEWFNTVNCISQQSAKVQAHSLFLLAAAPRRSVLVNDLWPYIAASTSVLSCVQDVLGKCIFVVCGGVIVGLRGVVCDSLLTADHESARDERGVER